MLLLAQMPTVIAPQHDDSVVTIRSVFERIDHSQWMTDNNVAIAYLPTNCAVVAQAPLP